VHWLNSPRRAVRPATSSGSRLQWHHRASVTAATKRAAQLDLLGNSVLGLLRACQAAIMAGDDLPADLHNDIGQLRAAVDALADNGIDAREGTATEEPIRRLAQRAPPGDGAYAPLITSLVRACARDVLRIHGLGEGA
jgi:hypothetical protein